MLNELKDKIQREAVRAWVEKHKKGTLELSTGTGKTIAALHCLYTMPRNDKVNVFLAETTEREKDLLNDILLYNKLFDVDVLKDYSLVFKCYQTVYKYEDYDLGLVIADEIHMALSPQYSQFFYNNKYDAIVGLSATVDRKTSYDVNGVIFTKGQLLDEIAPVCYTYTINQAKKDGVGRCLDVYVIYQELDMVNKNIPAGNAKKRFFQTEYDAYSYWDKEHKKSWFIEDQETKDMKIRVTSNKRSYVLFNLESKIKTIQELLRNIRGKTILFGNSLDALLKVTPDVVSSRKSDDQNNAIRDSFDSGKIKTIGSFKKLRQGANLTDLDNAIIMSYYSSEVHAIQQWGRLRKNGEKSGSIFILLTKNTQEEVWFAKMIENMSDFNIIYCKDLGDCLIKYKKNNGD
jgi:superfamily II DNA or RNA helicase